MRPIDADATITKIAEDAPDFTGEGKITKAFILAMLLAKDVTPTIDAVQVIRCKDCKYCFAEGFVHEHNICDKHEWIQGQPDDWFCADGKRRVKRE